MKLLSIFLQQTEAVNQVTQEASSNKLYVVVAVITILFIGMLTYLISLDRKIRNLEK